MGYEDEAEATGGPLPETVHASSTHQAMAAGVYGINMPAEWGGAGLTLLDQVIVSEEFGKVTNCLWTSRGGRRTCWLTAPRRSARSYLLPILRGELFDAFAVTEPDAGSDAARHTTATRTDGGWLINGEKWFVTCGDIAGVLLRAGQRRPDALADNLPGRQGPPLAC